jgi:hypothetical protein
VSLHSKKWLGKKDKKGWHYDKILVHLKKFAPRKGMLCFCAPNFLTVWHVVDTTYRCSNYKQCKNT